MKGNHSIFFVIFESAAKVSEGGKKGGFESFLQMIWLSTFRLLKKEWVGFKEWMEIEKFDEVYVVICW